MSSDSWTDRFATASNQSKLDAYLDSFPATVLKAVANITAQRSCFNCVEYGRCPEFQAKYMGVGRTTLSPDGAMYHDVYPRSVGQAGGIVPSRDGDIPKTLQSIGTQGGMVCGSHMFAEWVLKAEEKAKVRYVLKEIRK